MESNPLFAIQHAPTIFPINRIRVITFMDCKPALEHIESFSWVYRKRKFLVHFVKPLTIGSILLKLKFSGNLLRKC